MNFMGNYPYLVMSGLLFLIFLVIFMLEKRLRLLMFISGIGSALYSFSAVLFVPEYWQPVCVLNSIVGIENIIFSFANGGIVCFIALRPFRNKIKVEYNLGSLLAKFLSLTFIGIILGYFFKKMGASIMPCCLYAMVIIGAAIILKRNQYLPLCLAGGFGFTVLYLGIMGLLSLINPLFYTQWTLENLWGLRVLSFPLEEFVWAFGFGSVFTLIMAFSFGLILFDPKKKSTVIPSELLR